MLGTLRKEGGPSDRTVRVSSPTDVDGASRGNVSTDAWSSLGLADAALVLEDRPLEAIGASAVGSETDRVARGTSVFSKGTA
jgi:hypothetical protein